MAQQDKSFEGAWRSAFDHKSITPPVGVWENIENELDERNSKQVMPLVWRTAAAVSFLAVTIFIIQLAYNIREQNQIQVAVENKIENEGAKNGENNESLAIDQGNIIDKEKGNRTSKSYINKNKIAEDKNALAYSEKENNQTTGINSIASKEDQTDSYTELLPEDNLTFLESPEYLAHLPAAELKIQLPEAREIWGVPVYYSNKKSYSDEWFAGIDFAAGSSGSGYNRFSGSNLEFAVDPDLNSADKTYSSDIQTGSTLAYGLAVGKKVSKRIILESGISYMKIETAGYSNITFESTDGSRAVVNAYTKYTEAGQISSTLRYEYANIHQFISIPLKAEFLILDKNWKISFGSGFAGNYFFKTMTQDVSGDLESYESNPSESALWNIFNVTLLGEVNFRRQLGDHYILSLSPQLRQALNDYSKSDRVELKPAIIQLGMQLKYKF